MSKRNHLITNILAASLGLFLVTVTTITKAGTEEDIAAIKSKLQNKKPPLKAQSIKLSPIAGLYEVFVEGSLIYVDKDFSYIIVGGAMIDPINNRNLSEESLKEITHINFKDLPFEHAIEIKAGSGEYKFAVFSDPDCPSCKSLERYLAKSGLTDYTAYIFLYPLEELHPDAAVKSESIWCAEKKAETWSDWMVNDVIPYKRLCNNPISLNKNLAEDIGIYSTPTIYLSDGRQTHNPNELADMIKAKK